MKKFMIITSMVFVLALTAEWFILGAPSKGVVLDVSYQHKADSYSLRVLTNEGTFMDVKMPPNVWRSWFKVRANDN